MGFPVVAPPYLATAFFEDTSSPNGWSESFWVNGASYDTAHTNAELVITDRLKLLTPEMKFVFGRVSNASIRGDSYMLTPTTTMEFGTYEPAAEPNNSLPIDDVVLMRIHYTPTARHVTKFLRGIPRDSVSDDKDRLFTPTTEWKTRWATFRTTYAAQCKFVMKALPPGEGYEVLSISGVDYTTQIRNRKSGRPFGLLRGRSVRA